MAQRTTAPELLYLTTDHLGTPVLATDTAQSIAWAGGLEPFGRVWSAGDNKVFLRYPGQWASEAFRVGGVRMELYYNVNRWYETEMGRYALPDPLGLNGGPHLYSYVNDNPVTGIDALGLKVELYCDLIGHGNADFFHRLAGSVGLKHCFLRVRCDCDPDTYDLRLEIGQRNDATGLGVPEVHDFNTGHGAAIVPFEPADWDSKDCKMENCILQWFRFFQVLNPPYGLGIRGRLGGVPGWVLGPNSNTFAAMLLEGCGARTIDWPTGVMPYDLAGPIWGMPWH